jgi:hypothetical protein
VRSSSALVLSSTNANHERIYVQQPPIAASGYSSQAMNPHYPHTERKTETKTCSDCHLSANGDNNALLAQTLGQGTQFINFLGLNAWVGGAGELSAVTVTEWDEPQAVIGSYLQRYAYPDYYRAHQARGLVLPQAERHRAGTVGCLQLRGEYLYAAEGARGFRVYDVAGIANKGISQKIISAPFSPLGQGVHVATPAATCVVLGTTQPVHPPRNEGPLMRTANLEQPFAAIYNYAVITDAVDGLILVDINTFADGEFRNNFLRRALTWNPAGVLTGARHIALGGNLAYVVTPQGVAVVDLATPLAPRLLAQVDLPGARGAAAPAAPLRRRRRARGRARRGRRQHQRQPVRLCRRRHRRLEGAAAHRAGQPAQLLRLQPRTAAGTHRPLRHPPPGVVAVTAAGAGPGRGRNRRAGGRVRPPRLATLLCRGDGRALAPAGRHTVVRARLTPLHTVTRSPMASSRLRASTAGAHSAWTGTPPCAWPRRPSAPGTSHSSTS